MEQKVSNVQDEPEADACQCSGPRATLHRHRNHPYKNSQALEGQDPVRPGPPPARALQPPASKSKKHRGYLDGTAVDDLRNLWDKLTVLRNSLSNMPYAEGLKPLKCFASFEELLSMGGEALLCDLLDIYKDVHDTLSYTQSLLDKGSNCKSLNNFVQPFIAVVYGPTGCGKSQLLRNLMSDKLLLPPPETVFFITPHVNMIPPQEITAWQTQICEGNYRSGPDNTVIPQSGAILPEFVQMSYADLTNEVNYDVTHPENVFAKAAATGPIAIIMDECMEDLGGHKGVAKFFHAFPSKLLDKFPKCTGYSVIVVLHNMNPRRDMAGNISNLKTQAKMHIMSPKVHPSQLNRFINIYTKGLPTAITLLLKDIFNYHRMHTSYDWIAYSTNPEASAMQWMYLNPQEGLMPMYLNVQAKLYNALERIHKTLNDRQRWTRYYHSKKK
ncbi:IVa2 protein [Raccoon adenovirus]|nr:IVa2 protein [Raccoon adenovirus]UKT59845.1 IVa2 protein [Porcupine adenovirus]